jgi:site-specific DNA recombinase
VPPRKNKKSEPLSNKVIAYVRVSTDNQVEDGHSLEAQRARLEAYAQAFGLEIVGIETDAGLSAGTLERPGLKAALQQLRAGVASALLVTRLDRLTRSVKDFAFLVDTYFKTGECRLMSVNESIDTTTPTGRLILNVLMTVSEWEREAAAERTTAVMQRLKATGKFTGGFPPFGWAVDEDGALIISDVEQQCLGTVKYLREQGRSIRAIAGEVINPRTGRLFQATQIARML